jgi:hypothetical protein
MLATEMRVVTIFVAMCSVPPWRGVRVVTSIINICDQTFSFRNLAKGEFLSRDQEVSLCETSLVINIYNPHLASV